MGRAVLRSGCVVEVAAQAPRHAPARGPLLSRHAGRLASVSLGPLVSAGWLKDHLGDPDVRVIDFRWYLLDREGPATERSGHTRGAVFVDLEAVTGPQDATNLGRHPLPTAHQFEAEMQRAGVSSNTRVVVYDDAGGSVAARLWFLLGWFGHQAQAVLDGGLQVWSGTLESDVAPVGR